MSAYRKGGAEYASLSKERQEALNRKRDRELKLSAQLGKFVELNETHFPNRKKVGRPKKEE